METPRETYCELKSINPFRRSFLYFDVKDYFADQIFINHKIPVKFLKKEAWNPESEYGIIFCTIPNKYVHEFRKCMEDLAKKMLLTGHADYIDVSSELVEQLKKAVADA